MEMHLAPQKEQRSGDISSFYRECLNIANESLKKLGLNLEPDFIRKIIDPKALTKIEEGKEGKGQDTMLKILNWELWLSREFLNKRNIHTGLQCSEGNGPVKQLLSGMTARGMRIAFIEKEPGVAETLSAQATNTTILQEGRTVLECLGEITAQSGCMEPCTEIAKSLAVLAEAESRLGKGQVAEADFRRYWEGRSVFSKTSLLHSKDDEVRAYFALDFLKHIADPAPKDLKSGYMRYPMDELMSERRKSESFRLYYGLRARLGKESIDEFERVCVEHCLLPGIYNDGSLVMIDPSKARISKLDVDKLKEGVRDPEKLQKRPNLSFYAIAKKM